MIYEMKNTIQGLSCIFKVKVIMVWYSQVYLLMRRDLVQGPVNVWKGAPTVFSNGSPLVVCDFVSQRRE